ncbi:MAG: hypothetical protein ACP5H1_03805 [Acidilobus sp.]
MRLLGVLLLAALLMALLPSVAVAQYGYGTSEVVVSANNVTLYPGGSTTVSFTVKLVSGNTWGTNVKVVTSSSYISATASPSSGDPTFSGKLTITVASNAPPGVYEVNVSATGDDPSSSPATIYVYVKSNTTTTTSTTTTSVTSTTTTAPSSVATTTVTTTKTITTTSTYTTTVPSSSPSSSSLAPLAAFVVVVILSLAAVFGLGLLGPRRSAPALSLLTFIPEGYLLAFDSALRATAPLHYYLLAAYTAFSAAVGVTLLLRPLRATYALTAVIAGLMTLAMILDAALGLPLSSVYSPGSMAGIDYLFGMGLTPFSSLGVTLSFASLMLLSAGASGASIRALRARA